jgi:hypothetical protein
LNVIVDYLFAHQGQVEHVRRRDLSAKLCWITGADKRKINSVLGNIIRVVPILAAINLLLGIYMTARRMSLYQVLH